jgi:phosphoribosylformylglycinamidine cyclo-ligase
LPTYRDAGVDLEGADRHVSNISPLVKETWDDSVRGSFGGFAAGIELPPGYRRPILMMSTDGVGTKLELARKSGIWAGVGHDLVAMCVDDLAAVGARPLGFVDYLAVGSLDPERDTEIVASIARACREAGCALLGGETAEHSGVMESDAVDLAGAVVGVVEQGQEFNPPRVTQGDVVVGLASPNLRSNGFSLVRKLFIDPADFGRLLEPSVIYSPAVLTMADLTLSAAHITGGGLPGNLIRAVPPHLGVHIDLSSWERPEIFNEISSRGVSEAEMRSTFNLGIGFCLIVRPDDAGPVTEGLAKHEAAVIGEVTGQPGIQFS